MLARKIETFKISTLKVKGYIGVPRKQSAKVKLRSIKEAKKN